MKRPGLSAVPLLWLGLLSTVALAEPSAERAPLDLSVRFGGALGRVQQPIGVSKGTFGGFPIEASIYFNIGARATLELTLGGVADVNNFQISREGFGLQFDYHLLGGARRIETDYGNVLVIVRNPYNLSITARESYHHYSITPTDPDLDPFGGSVLQTNFGFQLRYDIGDSLALSLDVYMPIYVIAMSSDKLKPTVTEFLAGLRFFL